MIKISEIFRRARIKLLDTEGGDRGELYRWSDDELRDGVFNAVEHIHSIRPETRYVNGVLADFHVDGETEEIPVDPRFTEALVFYVVYCAYLKDDSDTENLQNAENYLAKANTLMQI